MDVSGDAGGGTVLLGGNAQGAGPQANALRSYVGPDAAIEADAISGGSGGQVVVWSDESTRFYGSISARGGARSGDGGFVEVSGREWLSFDGCIDAGAPRGLSGTILFDPRDITIQAAGANDASLTATGIAFNAPNQTADHTFSAAAIAALTGNITLQASRSLTVNQALNLANQTAGETVSLQAGNTITVNQSITTGGADLSITSAANSGWTGYSATGPITVAASLNAGGGSIALSSGGATTFSGAPTITANNLTLTASTLTTLNNATLAVSGALTAKPSTTASSIGLAGGAGTFSLDAAEIARIKASGASSVTLGAAGGTGALVMGANVDLAGRAVTLHSGRINDATRILIADSLTLNLTSTTGANTVRTNAGALSVNTSAGSSATNRSATITEADGVALGADEPRHRDAQPHGGRGRDPDGRAHRRDPRPRKHGGQHHPRPCRQRRRHPRDDQRLRAHLHSRGQHRHGHHPDGRSHGLDPQPRKHGGGDHSEPGQRRLQSRGDHLDGRQLHRSTTRPAGARPWPSRRRSTRQGAPSTSTAVRRP